MTDKDLLKIKTNILKEMDKAHIYNPKHCFELFKENVNFDNLGVIKGPNEYISREETIDLVSEFLGDVSEEYKEEFFRYLRNCQINFDSKECYCSGNVYNNDLVVNIKEEHNLFDVVLLTHEFFHALSSENYDGEFEFTRVFFNELPSILSELYMFDFLINKGYNPIKVTESRLSFFRDNVGFLFDYFKLYDLAVEDKFNIESIKEKFSNLSDNHINNMLNYFLHDNINLDRGIQHSFALLLALKIKKENKSYDKLREVTNNLCMMDLDDYENLLGLDLSKNSISNHLFLGSVNTFINQQKNYDEAVKSQI